VATPIDRAGFERIYEQHVDRLYRYALRCCGEPALAEDIVAETFRRALEHWPGFEWRGVPVAAWLYRIAGNLLAAHYRCAAAVPLDPAIQATLPDRAEGPERSVLRAERRREVRDAVATLPLAQRQAIVLRYGENLPLREIAVVLGRSEGAAKQCLHRALVTLHRSIA
jgi:RNA polymerase sigma-70 factor (ECF subfamily)